MVEFTNVGLSQWLKALKVPMHIELLKRRPPLSHQANLEGLSF